MRRLARPLLLIPILALAWVADPAARGGLIISVKDAYQDLLVKPDRNELDRALRDVVTTSIESGRHAEAVTRLAAIKDKYPNDHRVWFVLAVSELGGRRWTEALSAVDQCIRIRPDFLAAYWLKGAAQVGQSRLDDAEATFNQAAKLAPDQAGVYYQRGVFRVVYRSGDPAKVEAGIADLRQAMDRNAPPELVDGMLGKAYLALKDSRTAEIHLRRAFEQGTSQLNLDPLADLVALHDSAGRTPEAERVLVEAERRRLLVPSDRHDLHAGCFLIAARHAIAAARPPATVAAAFDRAISEQPRNTSARLEYARWLDGQGRNADAVPVLREGLMVPPFDTELSAQLAWALAESSQDLGEARYWLRKALASDPSSPYLADTSAWIAYREGKYRVALAAIGPSLGLVNEVPEVAYHAGAIHARLGNLAEAVRYLRKALEAGRPWPGDQRARELLAKLDR